MRTTPLYFPSQKIASSKKTDSWYNECLDAAEALCILKEDAGLNQHHKMQVWENLDNDIIDEDEIEKVFNPMKLQDAVFPAAIKNYPLSVPKIDLLQGEEIKRKFDWKVMAKNEDSYSAHTDAIKDEIMRIVMEEIQNEAFDEKSAQEKIQKTSKYFQYEYKDLNELYGTRVLEYLWREQDLHRKFSMGFRDALVKGRELYRIDDIGGEPGVVKTDVKKVFFLRKGDSHKIEDADILIEISYEPVGKIIDEFHDYLKPTDIDNLEAGMTRVTGTSGGVLNHENSYPTLMASSQMGGLVTDDAAMMSTSVYNLPFDYEGNVRVVRARWVGRRKIGRVSFYNEVTGDQEEKLVSEHYKINEELGETVKWLWVNEAYENTRLGQDLYVKGQPRKIQMRHFDNPSKCFLGYVGTDYGKSLMARMESYQYLYNVYMRRLELAIAKYKGPIYELDTSKKPDEWSTDMWMYYAEVLGWSVVDSFNEGKKGQATGKLAGNFNTTGKVLDADVGNYIQQLIMMLQYIEKQMGQIAGVTDQRQGMIDNRETVGGVERAVTQSSHITEKWFFIHDETKKRVMLALLDTAKQLWKNKKSKKIAYIMDDMARVAMDVNGEDFASTEYDMFITDSSDDLKIRSTIEQLSHAFVQNGGSLTLPIKVLRSDSITQMAKLIEEEETKTQQQQQEMEEKKMKSQEGMQQAVLEDKQADRELEVYKIDTQRDTQLQVAAMKNQQEVPEAEADKPDIMAQKKLELDKEKTNKQHSLAKEQLSETIRHNKATETISKMKPKTTTKK